MPDYTFPADLIALRREFIQAGRELQDLPNGGDQEQRRGELRDRERGLAVQYSGHPYWQEYEGDVTEAKFALHQVAVDELDAG